MSLIVDKLKQVGQTRTFPRASLPEPQKIADVVSPAPPKDAPSTVTLSKNMFLAILGCWALVLALALGLNFSDGSNHKIALNDSTRTVRQQNERIAALQTALAESDGRYKKYSQNIDERLRAINFQLIKTDKEKQEMASSVNTLDRNVRSLQIATRSAVDKYNDLSREVRVMKVLTAQGQDSIIETGRK